MDKVFAFIRAVRHTLDRIEIRMPTEGRSSFGGLLALEKGFVLRIAYCVLRRERRPYAARNTYRYQKQERRN